MEIEDVLAIGNKQRVFRAKYKVDQPGFVSHITQRAAGKEPLFLEQGDNLHFLALLKENAAKFNLVYYAFCLMPNHVHLLLKPLEANLAQAMHSIFTGYASYFNRKYQRRGHLFGGRYRQALCLAPDYLLAASVYIHLNPVRAGLAETATSYPWSSVALYCEQPRQKSFLEPGLILSLLDDDPDEARQKYARLVHHEHADIPENAQEKPKAIEKFCESLGAKFPGLFRRLQSASAAHRETALPLAATPSLETLFFQFPTARAVGPETRRAKQYVLQQLLARGFTRSDIAARLKISRKTVYNLLRS